MEQLHRERLDALPEDICSFCGQRPVVAWFEGHTVEAGLHRLVDDHVRGRRLSVTRRKARSRTSHCSGRHRPKRNAGVRR
jgi:hypothetical protein